MEDVNLKTVKELKNDDSIITYLSFLQSNISRMSTNSNNIKALIAVIYTILITVLIAVNSISKYWWIGIFITIVGLILDSYYLAIERMYRKKYNIICKKVNSGNIDVKEIYDMNPKNTDLENEITAEIITSFSSISVFGYYMLFISISILLKIM